MDTNKVIWTQLQAEIFRVLCIKTGITLNLRELARLTKKTPTAVSNSISQLKKEEIVTIEKSEKMNLLSINLNRDNPRVIELKRVENLKLIYETGLSDYLRENFPGNTIILFGSYSRGEDTLKSDIDIAIVGTKEKEKDYEKFDKLLERGITINFFDSFKSIHKNLKDNILNGIILHGGIEL